MFSLLLRLLINQASTPTSLRSTFESNGQDVELMEVVMVKIKVPGLGSPKAMKLLEWVGELASPMVLLSHVEWVGELANPIIHSFIHHHHHHRRHSPYHHSSSSSSGPVEPHGVGGGVGHVHVPDGVGGGVGQPHGPVEPRGVGGGVGHVHVPDGVGCGVGNVENGGR